METLLKISEDIKKINNPGILQVIRFFDKDGSLRRQYL